MKLSTREDIDAPVDEVFAAFADFDRFERLAMRRGAEVERLDANIGPCAGMGWRARFHYNGRQRELRCEVVSLRAPEDYQVQSDFGGINGLFSVEMIALSPKRTRVKVGLDLRPGTLSARLYLQSLRLAKGSLERRFKSRVAAIADDLRSRNLPG